MPRKRMPDYSDASRCQGSVPSRQEHYGQTRTALYLFPFTSISSEIMGTSSHAVLDFHETSGLQSPTKWRAILPPLSSIYSASTPSPSSWRPVNSNTPPTVNFRELGDEGRAETNLSPNNLRNDVLPCSLAGTTEATDINAVGKARLQDADLGFANASGDTNATAPALNAACNQPRLDRNLPTYLPRRYDKCPVDDMVELISHMLAEVIAMNGSNRIISGKLTRFHSK